MFLFNKTFFLVVAIIFNVITIAVIISILDNKEKLRISALLDQYRTKDELSYFPRYCSSKAMICYAVTLALVSAIFFTHAMPFQFMLFGFAAVIIFFSYTSKLTTGWRNLAPSNFAKKLFSTAVFIRIAYTVFIYFYYIAATGEPHMYNAGDELFYHDTAAMWKEFGYDAFMDNVSGVPVSDSGYCWWLAIEYLLLGTNPLPARLVKCVIDAFSCVLIYSLAERNFGERTGRIAAVFYMMMPNTWYYCGISLKETELAFLVILFVERADLALRSRKIKLKDLFVPLLVIVVMFTFRTAMAAVLAASLVAALILTPNKKLQMWKKVLYTALFAVWMMMTVGVELLQEAQIMLNQQETVQESGYQWRAQREGGNAFAQYASASIFAPMIFTMPFSSMVSIANQENQMMLNGGNFVKNVLSGFTIFALFLLLIRKEWRGYALPLAVMCGYLVVLVFSNFAHSERFHFPILGLELMFAAYGVSQMTNRQKRWYSIWLVVVFIANFGWALIKLRGRGLA